MSDLALARLVRDGAAAFRRGDHRSARDLARQVLASRRTHLDALMLLAEVAHAERRHDEELAHVQTAARHHPGHARLRAHLGRCHAFRGDHGKAIVQFDKAIKLDPDDPAPVAGKADVFVHQNRYEKAEAVLAPRVRDDAPPPAIAAVHLRVLLHDDRLDEAIGVGEAVLGSGHEPGVPLREVALFLAQAYERAGRFDDAFATAGRANAMVPALHDAEADERRIEDLVATFTRARLAAAPRPAAPSELPVFVVGMPRSGTTLVERIIASHPAAHGAGEIPTLSLLVRDLPWRIGSTLEYPACVEDLDQADVEALAEVYIDEIRALAPRATRVVDKDLVNYRHLGAIEILLPRARIVHCRRDPLDTCLSCYLAPFDVPYASDLERLGRSYRGYARLMRHWRDVLDVPVLELDYETLVGDQERVTREVVDFCGLRWDDACLRFHETRRHERTLSYDQVRRPIYRSSIGRAERYGGLLDPLREALGDER